MGEQLNSLSGKEWVQSTKSVWMTEVPREDLLEIPDVVEQGSTGVLLSEAAPRDSMKKQHPATFYEKDIAKLIEFFTKPDEVVLDPFCGVASTGIACLDTGRNFIGVELYQRWLEIAQARLEQHRTLFSLRHITLLHKGDSMVVLKTMPEESVDFIVTSPPYWSILDKQDHKAKAERIALDLPTDYGQHENDLANIESYQEFLNTLQHHFEQYHRLLKVGRYTAIIVSDFRHKQQYYMFHAHVAERLEKAGFVLQGLINLVQDNKHLYPYGFPTTYVPNISNQYVVLARKL